MKQKGYETGVFDCGLESDGDKLKVKIKEFQPDLIGVTSFSYCYQNVFELIGKIRKMTKTPLVIGGPHVSAVRKQILEDTKADFAVKSEGEFTLLELLKELPKGKTTYSKILGLIWRKGKRIIENPDRPLIKDLDGLPFPDYDAFGIEKYPCFRIKALPIMTSRGCPYGCTYCSVKLSMGRGFRPRSPENVLSEIKYWYKKGWTNIDINDDCFTLVLERAEKICDLIIKNKMKIKFQLYNGIRVDRITPQLLRKLNKAGCTFIAYGCEAGNQKILDSIQKHITLDQVKQAVTWTNKIGIKNAVNFIIGHPMETYDQAKETLSFAESLPTNFVNFYNLVPYPGTDSFQWAKAHAHFLYPPDTFLRTVSYRDNSPIFETKEFTKEQRQDIMQKGFDLYERKILKFRLGSTLGLIIYLLSRPKIMHKLIFDFALTNKIGNAVYQLFSAPSRN
ncbi:hypothetical protein A2V71_03310 [Candidatus Berkelbacteria bacterium RBG_13_40_8]|uniref:Uncharacterized protein n=1 Tax=Candidatus Berkelbacteria bacterium RBG_13_40_8 TaxID=1797467 RepID=A0A1F5DM39_9BACT|nr:MAG: hypothetical protein A2V71_03310 [Candidatus Berkelbacteria bacterium RBG_13_40_8]